MVDSGPVVGSPVDFWLHEKPRRLFIFLPVSPQSRKSFIDYSIDPRDIDEDRIEFRVFDTWVINEHDPGLAEPRSYDMSVR